jgi:hypothetical protein
MARYQVKFYKDVLSSDGHPYRCVQSDTEVQSDGPTGAMKRILAQTPELGPDWGISIMPLEPATIVEEEAAA